MRSTQESSAAATIEIRPAVPEVTLEVPVPSERNEARRDTLVVAHLIEAGQGGIETAVCLLVNAQELDPAIGDIHIVADRTRLGEALLKTPATMHF